MANKSTLNRRQTLAYLKARKANLRGYSYLNMRLAMDKIQMAYVKLDVANEKQSQVAWLKFTEGPQPLSLERLLQTI